MASIVNYPERWAVITGQMKAQGKPLACYCSLEMVIFLLVCLMFQKPRLRFSIAQLHKVCQFLVQISMRISDRQATTQPSVTHCQHVSVVIRKQVANKFQQTIFLSPHTLTLRGLVFSQHLAVLQPTVTHFGQQPQPLLEMGSFGEP